MPKEISLNEISESLHPLEKKVLPHLKDKMFFSDLVKESKLKDIEVMRALQWLQNKEFLNIDETSEEIIELEDNGIIYKEKGLPEKRFLEAIKNTSEKNPMPISEITEKYDVDKQEVNISIGILKRKVAIEIVKENGLSAYITEQGKKMLSKKSLEESFIESKFPKPISSLSEEEKFAFNELLKRKQIIKKSIKKTKYITLTKAGKFAVKDSDKLTKDSSTKIGKITPELLKSGKWKKSEFRPYDIKAKVPAENPGKIHFVNQAIRYIKQIWLEMGFVEMEGNHVHTAFRDLDALFVPQDHPAREMQDTFYIGNPKTGKLPPKLKEKVKAMHEHGGNTNSKGWQYEFSYETASQNLLRTHTTVLSAETIAKLKKEDLPKKFFSVGKVYRNEALDWKHLFEFYQVEGIVIDPNANFKHLIGYLTEYYNKMGFEKIRIRPGHFPYTEPSLEVEAFHPKKKEWVELGGAGIFRPEVVIPLLGEDIPVLAWGQGMERSIVEYFAINNLRDLYRNDIKQIKEMKYWMK
ncbi:MAG: phenylalanine--tRNA ligase subunit alpha [Candidatus Woesearchaeota archaeon]